MGSSFVLQWHSCVCEHPSLHIYIHFLSFFFGFFFFVWLFFSILICLFLFYPILLCCIITYYMDVYSNKKQAECGSEWERKWEGICGQETVIRMYFMKKSIFKIEIYNIKYWTHFCCQNCFFRENKYVNKSHCCLADCLITHSLFCLQCPKQWKQT